MAMHLLMKLLSSFLKDGATESNINTSKWWVTLIRLRAIVKQFIRYLPCARYCSVEKELAAHSSVLAWRIPGLGEPGGLPSMGSHRVGHDWSDSAAAADIVLRALHLLLPLISMATYELSTIITPLYGWGNSDTEKVSKWSRSSTW